MKAQKSATVLKSNKRANDVFRVSASLLLGGLILYWMYRDFDFRSVSGVLLHGMDWTWMLLSLPFGILAQAFRGWRWHMTLDPMGEKSRKSVCINAIFLSYAMSLVVPRVGEFARCAVLNRCDRVSFAKSLGTVVTERVIDSLLLLLIAAAAFLWQFGAFERFFSTTGTNVGAILGRFTATGYVVTGICALAAVLLCWFLRKRIAVYTKMKSVVDGVWQGIVSVRHVRSLPLYALFTVAIWASYFLHYYLTFFSFPALSGAGFACAFATFIVGSIAVIVPTPNGAGPWHFAVKTMLVLYGIASESALYFVLIVHAVQTLLVVLLGVYAWIALSLARRTEEGIATVATCNEETITK